LLLSSDKFSVKAEAEANIAAQPRSPWEFVRNPVMLEFLGLPGTGKLLEVKAGAGRSVSSEWSNRALLNWRSSSLLLHLFRIAICR
jgi:hypothetical protein